MPEVIVLAGGFGTRLRELVTDVPKPMAPVCEKPFLAILLCMLAERGVDRVILSVGYMSEKIVDYFGNSFKGIDISYSVEDTPLGTGGAVRIALDMVKSDHALILNGDTFIDLEIDKIESHWQKQKRPIIVGKNVIDSERYGCLIARKGRVKEFTEKGAKKKGIINAGCYVLEKKQLNAFSPGANFSFEQDYLQSAVKEKDFDLFITHGKFIDIGVPEDYRRAQLELTEYIR